MVSFEDNASGRRLALRARAWDLRMSGLSFRVSRSGISDAKEAEEREIRFAPSPNSFMANSLGMIGLGFPYRLHHIVRCGAVSRFRWCW